MNHINVTSPCCFPHASSVCFATDSSPSFWRCISPKQASMKKWSACYSRSHWQATQALHYGSPRTQIGLGVEKPY